MLNRSPALLQPRPDGSASEPLFRNRRKALTGALLLLLVSIAAVRFPNQRSLLEEFMRSLGLPLASGGSFGSGLQYGGILLLAGAITGLVLLIRSVSRRKFLLFLAVFVLFNAAPPFWLYAYQSTLAQGLYAVEIEHRSKNCSYREENGRVQGRCTFIAHNRNSRLVEASAVLHQTVYSYGQRIADSRLPIPIAQPVTLESGENRVVELAFDLPAGSLAGQSGSGNGMFLITLTDGRRTRSF